MPTPRPEQVSYPKAGPPLPSEPGQPSSHCKRHLFKSPEQLVIGADPKDMTNIPTVPVKSVPTPWAVATIVAHEGEGQEVADP